MSLDASLARLGKLEHNWDGYDGARPSRSAIETIQCLTAVPLGSGAIQLEMHAGGADIEIVIGDDGRVASVYWQRS